MDVAPPEGGMPSLPPIAAQIVREPPPPRSPPRSPWKRLLLTLMVLALLGSVALNFLLVLIVGLSAAEGERRIQEKHLSHNRAAADKVAVIAVEGVIMQGEDGFVKRQIDRVGEDENVKAVVLRVDSPGGGVNASDYIYHHLRKMLEKRKIPMVVSMGGLAASGGYYVSMAVGHSPDVVFAEPTCFTGSIGVIIPHYNLGGLLDKLGVAEDSVASGPLKEMGTFTRKMTVEERLLFQGLVDDSFSRFKEIVRSGRLKFQKDPAALNKLATGQVFAADRAKENGLIDKIGFLEDAVNRAIALAELDKDKVNVVHYKPEVSLASLLMGGQSQGRVGVDLQALLELSTPRAYYLCTWLPAWPPARRAQGGVEGRPINASPALSADPGRRDGSAARRLGSPTQSRRCGVGRVGGHWAIWAYSRR